jgi:hypothetical protein
VGQVCACVHLLLSVYVSVNVFYRCLRMCICFEGVCLCVGRGGGM